MSGKIAFMFSGQGAQYPGMGKELYDAHGIVRQTYEEAGDALGFSVADLTFEEDARLNQTEYTQPAMFTLSVAIYRLAAQKGLEADCLLGLSLGEYAALCASGAMEFGETAALLRKRGKYMTEAVPSGAGMTALMGLDRETVSGICTDASDAGEVYPANYNMPGQIVFGGLVPGLEKAEALAAERGGKRSIRLNVSGPFHTPLLAPAAEKLAADLAGITFGRMSAPVVVNRTARPIAEGEIAENLIAQIISPVLWEDSVQWLTEQGVDTFVEMGPGKTLCSFVKKINRDVTAMNIENAAGLAAAVDYFAKKE